jgi:predicted phosphodiesterase
MARHDSRVRVFVAVVAVALVYGCAAEGDGSAIDAGLAEQAMAVVATTVPVLESAPAPAKVLPAPLTFAVLSDLHLPNFKAAAVRHTIAALIAAKVRFVVITGDFTNGGIVDGRSRQISTWWSAVADALEPLHAAGIAVLPVAGNHDTYLAWQRAGYATTFADLDRWAAPLTVRSTGQGFGAAPYSYSVEVEGVHLALTHVVQQALDKDVEAWLASDLATARDARLRLVFGHVPMSSVIRPPAKRFAARLGAVLAAGGASAYIAGHEHVVWDEDVPLPGGGTLRQVLVGCSSGFYDYGPSTASKLRAGCVSAAGLISAIAQPDAKRCLMPNGGLFGLVRGRKGRMIQHYGQSYTLITVTPDSRLDVTPMTIDDDGEPRPFYLGG